VHTEEVTLHQLHDKLGWLTILGTK